MPNRFTRADVVEVPLPSDWQSQQCLPLVVMQPAADISNYMLKSVYATNGQPGVVDHAAVADSVTAVNWGNIVNVPAAFPPLPHALTHLTTGSDPIPLASPTAAGLSPKGDGQPSSYLGGDLIYHSLPGIFRFRSEGPVTIDPSMTAGAIIFSSSIANPAEAVYLLDEVYLYGPNMTHPPSGMVHADIYDPTIPGWVQVTASTDISVMIAATYLLRPIMTSAGMTQSFEAAPNALSWRLVLDQATGAQCYFQAGIALYSGALPQLP